MMNSRIIMYQTGDGLIKIETKFDGDTVWLSIDQIAELFQRDKSTISRHIKNIFTEGELERHSVVANYATTATDGKTYKVDYYNIDVIISVGYRVRSLRGTQFRIWANKVLKEYLKKGFAMNDDLLKNAGGGNYFQELQAIRQKPMYMKDWIGKLDDFIKTSGNELLDNAGKISHEEAKIKAELEYDKYKERSKDRLTKVERDFIEHVKNTQKKLEKGKG